MLSLRSVVTRRFLRLEERNSTMPNCIICGAGDFTPRLLHPASDDLIIAADGGLENLNSININPHIILGDFDSLPYRPNSDAIVYPEEKDDTDMLLAVRCGLQRGYTRFRLYGALGGRLSHTIANLQTLLFLREKGAHGFLIGEDSIITVAKNESVEFSEGCQGLLSVFSAGRSAHGVTLCGLKYTLEDAELSDTFPVGVSNAFTGAASQVKVKDGALMIVWESVMSDDGMMRFT